jgi:hypothetical protein
MTRRAFIERFIIQYYGGLPEDDSELTYDIINAWLPDAIGQAAKANYIESIKIDGVSYVNNSFYTTFSGLQITSDPTDNLCYKFDLPEIPVGIGRNEGMAEVRFQDSGGFTSQPAIPVSISEWGILEGMPRIINKLLVLQEGKVVRVKSSFNLTPYTATVKIISGGDSTDLDSELNVPPDYFPAMQEYLKQQLMLQKAQKQDVASDGVDMA